MDPYIRMAASHPACKLLSRHRWKRKNSRVCRYCYSVSMAEVIVCCADSYCRWHAASEKWAQEMNACSHVYACFNTLQLKV